MGHDRLPVRGPTAAVEAQLTEEPGQAPELPCTKGNGVGARGGVKARADRQAPNAGALGCTPPADVCASHAGGDV